MSANTEYQPVEAERKLVFKCCRVDVGGVNYVQHTGSADGKQTVEKKKKKDEKRRV